MSRETPNWSAAKNLSAAGLRFAVVVARYNSAITGKLLEGAKEALQGADRVDVFDVPGAFELPFAVLKLALKDADETEQAPTDVEEVMTANAYHAIVALGAVVRGDTPHFDYVAGECARGLQQVALETGIPVAFGVLTTDTVEQAEIRAGGSMGNKGYDAALTAIEMARFGQ